MAKHTLKEILGIFSHHAGHTHEAAVQAVYDAGHARSREEFAAGSASPPVALNLNPRPTAPEGVKTDEVPEASAGQASETQAGAGQPSEESQGAQGPAA